MQSQSSEYEFQTLQKYEDVQTHYTKDDNLETPIKIKDEIEIQEAQSGYMRQQINQTNSQITNTDIMNMFQKYSDMSKGFEQGQIFEKIINYCELHFDKLTDSFITQIIMDPNILWQKRFLQEVNDYLPSKQKLNVVNWFLTLNERQFEYINEIEQANNILKGQLENMQYENQKLKPYLNEIINEANYIENRKYFLRKRQKEEANILNQQKDEPSLQIMQQNFKQIGTRVYNQEDSKEIKQGQYEYKSEKKENEQDSQEMMMQLTQKKVKNQEKLFYDKMSTSCKMISGRNISDSQNKGKREQFDQYGYLYFNEEEKECRGQFNNRGKNNGLYGKDNYSSYVIKDFQANGFREKKAFQDFPKSRFSRYVKVGQY